MANRQAARRHALAFQFLQHCLHGRFRSGNDGFFHAVDTSDGDLGFTATEHG